MWVVDGVAVPHWGRVADVDVDAEEGVGVGVGVGEHATKRVPTLSRVVMVLGKDVNHRPRLRRLTLDSDLLRQDALVAGQN